MRLLASPLRCHRTRAACLWALIVIAWLGVAPVQAQSLIDLMKQPGHVALMRHANAPIGTAPRETGASAETLGPCETQRNLDDKGRADARRIGEVFRRQGVAFERVYTSKWCRCRETAELIVGGPVDNLPLINSFFSDPDKTKGPEQIAALKRYLNDGVPRAARLLLVTHGSLIHGIAGFWTDETEVVVVRADGAGGLIVVGRGVP